MTIRDKYFGWKDIFFDRFVHCCNEKSGQPQGSNIPLAKINFDNKTGYVEDGHRKDYDKNVKITQCLEVRRDKNTVSIKKSNCLTTVMKDNVISSLPPGRYLNAFDLKDKFRYLTPVEICRLQTLPDDYLDGIAPNTAMSLAGNGWTVDVIAHLLRSIERKQMNDIVKEFRKITDELMFGSSETGTNVTCDKHEQNEAIRKSQNS